jgi:hypothetical protein
VCNLDQTSVTFDDCRKTTIARSGQKSVNINKPIPKHGSCATVNLAVTGSGFKLPAHVIIKGTKKGRITIQELPRLHRKYNNLFLSCQENAWCDKESFQEWIRMVWKPFTESKYPLPTLLILDQNKVHRQEKVIETLQSLGTLVIHLPPGETSQL